MGQDADFSASSVICSVLAYDSLLMSHADVATRSILASFFSIYLKGTLRYRTVQPLPLGNIRLKQLTWN